jgi:hypothetical protein
MHACAHHDISRRGFASLALAGAGSLLLPDFAFAAPTDALSIMCIDHRFVTRTIGFFNRPPQAGAERYDLVALAGASLAGVAEKLEETVPGFWQQVATAAGLHHIHRVVLLDHMKCGAYEKEFNNGNEMPPAVERAHHRDTWVKVAAEFHKRRDEGTLPPLRLSFSLMETSGQISEHREYR